jgi:hypothetical protein
MPPFGVNPPNPLDFRYPGSFGLNQSAKLPDKFGPPDMSQQINSSLSALADPIVAGMKESQNRAEAGKIASEGLASLNRLYTQQQGGAGGTTMPGATGTSGTGTQASTSTGDVHAPLAAASPEVRDSFMNTVKAGGLTNPYGLAAVAATGQAESNWSPGRLTSAWNDLGKPSGGAMSWRAERLQAMRNFTRGAEDPAVAQAQFFLKEDPQLVAALNEAKSPEEANALMANAWRYKGYNQPGTGEYARREALTRQYAAKMAPAAAPQPAPTASFAPQVAPAPTPEARAAVTAPTAQQQAPQQAGPTEADYQREIYAALNRGDKAKATELAAERDMVAAQRRSAQPQQAAPQQAAPQQPQAQGAAPGPQSQQQAPQDPQLAQQQQAISTVGQATQEQSQRLEGIRQQGQRMRVASLDPGAGVSPALPGLNLGQGMPGAPQQAPQPQPPAMAEPSFFDPQPMVPPQLAARPTTPAPPAPAAAPAAPAGPSGPPPQQPAGVPQTPYQVAQAQGLPPVVSGQQRGAYDPRMAEVLLKSARTPEEAQRILLGLYGQLQPPAASADRFQTTHDANGNWVQTDRLTGATRVSPMQGSQKAEQTVEVESGGGKQRFQWNPRTQRYDIPVAGGAPASNVPNKEVREAERQLFNDFESTETVKKYRELEQGVQGLKAAFTGGSASSDLVAVIQLFKAIDPGSTVTANESASVSNAAGVPERLRALFNQGVGEGGKFSPELRAEIFNTAQRLQQGRVQQVEKHASAYRNRAKAYGLDPDRTIAFDPFKFEKASPKDFPDTSRRTEESAAPGAARAPGASRENPLDVPSMAAAESLPAGTYFRFKGRIGVIE